MLFFKQIELLNIQLPQIVGYWGYCIYFEWIDRFVLHVQAL